MHIEKISLFVDLVTSLGALASAIDEAGPVQTQGDTNQEREAEVDSRTQPKSTEQENSDQV